MTSGMFRFPFIMSLNRAQFFSHYDQGFYSAAWTSPNFSLQIGSAANQEMAAAQMRKNNGDRIHCTNHCYTFAENAYAAKKYRLCNIHGPEQRIEIDEYTMYVCLILSVIQLRVYYLTRSAGPTHRPIFSEDVFWLHHSPVCPRGADTA